MREENSNQRPVVKEQTQNWQQIIWREWRNCEDEEYAQHLFNLAANEPMGWKNQLLIALLGVWFGAQAGFLLDMLPVLPMTPLLTWVGVVGGGLGGVWLGRRKPMRWWLAALTPNNIFPGLAWPYKFMFLALILFIGLYFQILFGLLLGFSSGLFLGLVLGLLSWPFLGLVSLISFQGQLLTGTDLMMGWASAGVGIGIGVLLGVRPNPKLDYQYRFLCFWWKEPPLITELSHAVQRACQSYPQAGGAWQSLQDYLKTLPAPQHSPETYLAMLAESNWQKRFMGRQALIMLGGEAVKTLQFLAQDPASSLHQTALWLLRDIERETQKQLNALSVCRRCWLRCQEYMVPITPDLSFLYWGCRGCCQSRDIAQSEVMIAVLDEEIKQEWSQKDGHLRVNWLARRSLFDFERVEIIQATDEEVERFVVQVGNDTDVFRQQRYSQMLCQLAPECHLSENTLRILERTFGQVEQSQPMTGEPDAHLIR